MENALTSAIAMTVEDLAEAFELLGEWTERYRYIIDLGQKLPPLDETDRIDENLVNGCQNKVWIAAHPTADPTRLEFAADSESAIVKGLIAILLMVCAGRTREEICSLDYGAVFTRLGLDQHLSPARQNGLHGAIRVIQDYAGN